MLLTVVGGGCARADLSRAWLVCVGWVNARFLLSARKKKKNEIYKSLIDVYVFMVNGRE